MVFTMRRVTFWDMHGKISMVIQSANKFPDETMHDDIGTNADIVYGDYVSDVRLEM